MTLKYIILYTYQECYNGWVLIKSVSTSNDEYTQHMHDSKRSLVAIFPIIYTGLADLQGRGK